jgi:hypothetical protein
MPTLIHKIGIKVARKWIYILAEIFKESPYVTIAIFGICKSANLCSFNKNMVNHAKDEEDGEMSRGLELV